jgi:hypothetical protein
LGSDRDTDFVGEHEAAQPLEKLLGEEDLNVTEKFGLVIGREASKYRHVALDDCAPRRRNRLRAKFGSAPTGHEIKDHIPIIRTRVTMRRHPGLGQS